MVTDPVERHLRYLQQHGSEGSVYARRRALARMVPLVGKPLLEATGQDLLAWQARLNLSPGAMATYVAHARGFYSWAIEMELITPPGPAACLRCPKVPRLLPRPIGEDDLMTAIAAAPQPVRAMLVLAAWVGLRAKEIALLRRSCVLDRADPPMLLVAADATKGHRERLVPLAPFVIAELHAAGLPRAGLVFRRRDGGPGPNKPWTISATCNTYLHGVGIPETLHQLRHRFGTKTYQGSKDLRLVQELLGHARPSTTAGYAAYDQATAAAAVAALPVPGLRKVAG